MAQQPTPQNTVVAPVSVANETELASIVIAGAPAGTEIFVVAPPSGAGKYYTYLPADVTAAQAGLVVAAKGGGNFVVQNNGITQSVFTEVAAGGVTLTNGAGASTLLTANITTIGGDLEIDFTAAVENLTLPGNASFEVLLDGVNVGPGASNGAIVTTAVANQRMGLALKKRKTGVAAGAHAVTIRWTAGGGGNTASILPANFEHASLLVKEVTR